MPLPDVASRRAYAKGMEDVDASPSLCDEGTMSPSLPLCPAGSLPPTRRRAVVASSKLLKFLLQGKYRINRHTQFPDDLLDALLRAVAEAVVRVEAHLVQ